MVEDCVSLCMKPSAGRREANLHDANVKTVIISRVLLDICTLLMDHELYASYHQQYNGIEDPIHIEAWHEDVRCGWASWERRARYGSRLELPGFLKLGIGTQISGFWHADPCHLLCLSFWQALLTSAACMHAGSGFLLQALMGITTVRSSCVLARHAGRDKLRAHDTQHVTVGLTDRLKTAAGAHSSQVHAGTVAVAFECDLAMSPPGKPDLPYAYIGISFVEGDAAGQPCCLVGTRASPIWQLDSVVGHLVTCCVVRGTPQALTVWVT